MLLSFVMSNVDADDWKTKWRPEFQYDPATQKRMNRRLAGIKPASGDKRATITFPKGRAKPYGAPPAAGQGNAPGGG